MPLLVGGVETEAVSAHQISCDGRGRENCSYSPHDEKVCRRESHSEKGVPGFHGTSGYMAEALAACRIW